MGRGLLVGVGSLAALLVGSAHAADKPEAFAPPVGSSIETHSTLTIKTASQPDQSVQSDIHREVLENDGLTTKYSNKVVSQSTSGGANPSQLIDSPDNYTVYRSFLIVEVSSISKSSQNGEMIRVHQQFDCDKAAIQSFLPLGRVPSVQVPCKLAIQSGEHTFPPKQLVLTISYEGESKTTTPAGTFSVANIRVVSQDGESRSDTLYLIDTARGLPVSSVAITTAPDRKVEATSQLVGFKLAGG